MTQLPTPASRTSAVRGPLIGGTITAVLLVCAIGGWAATARVSGAVIARGTIVVDSSVKKVQHPTGGVVGELRVRDGDIVQRGAVVIRLDDTISRASLGVITARMDELFARQARLNSEQNGLNDVRFPEEVMAAAGENAAGLLRDEMHLFELRRTALLGQQAQLRERVSQLREQIRGVSEQITAKSREIALISDELKGVHELWQKNLVPITRVNALERDATRLTGELGALIATNAQLKGRITETELQTLQIEQDFRTEASKELAEIRAELSELRQRRAAAEDQLQRIEIRAPQDGIVHELSVHTVGGVVEAGEPLMLIVPQAEALTVEARIPPQDIDQVIIGQTALLRFSAFNQRTTPELRGEVRRVSGDVTQDPKTGATFYTIRITPVPAELALLNGFRLVPGMPVESFIQTGERTVMSYLFKPISDQILRAWRER